MSIDRSSVFGPVFRGTKRSALPALFLATAAAGCKTTGGGPLVHYPTPIGVTTQRNDNDRTGVNSHEYALTVASVSSGQFQKIFSYPVNGQVYAQPLIVPRVKDINGTTRNLLVVVTMHNILHVFDADAMLAPPASSPVELAQIPLGTPVPFNFMPMAYTDAMLGIQLPGPSIPSTPSNNPGYYNIFPEIGAASTPVVDTTTMRLYVVNKSLAGPGVFRFQLWCFNLTNLANPVISPSPVTIAGSVQGSGAGSVNNVLGFDPKMHLQRPALLLSQGSIYIAFGSHQDTPPFHGWIFRYDANTLQQQNIWSSTPLGGGGGIWQAGSGLASDDIGRVYAMTGNGIVASDVLPPSLAQSFVQLSPTLGYLGSYTPTDATTKGTASDDIDLGSSGPVLLPNTGVLIGAGKDGQLYLLDRNTFLGMRQIFQASQSEDGGHLAHTGFHHVHGSPVAWRNSPSTVQVYLWAERDNLRRFSWSDATATFVPTAAMQLSTIKTPSGSFFHPTNMPGGILSLSSNGSTQGTAVLWAAHETKDDGLTAIVGGTLRAFNAEDITMELWNSDQNFNRDGLGLFSKNGPPTVANGRVYMATFSGSVLVYGLRQWASMPWPGNCPSSVKSGSTFTCTFLLDNDGITTWSTAGNYHLGTQSPQDNTTWGSNRFDLPQSVPPHTLVSVDVKLTAPTVSAASQFQLRLQMVQDGVEWFGEITPNKIVTVVP